MPPQLSLPVVGVRESFVAAMSELVAEGRGRADDYSILGMELRELPSLWSSEAGFAEYVRRLHSYAHAETPRQPGWVPETTWWWIDGSEYLGRIALRHHLTPHLIEEGGHIGYDVRPTARRRGYATQMLREVVREARARGIDRVLVTCDATNVASRRVIEKNGGVLEDQRGDKLRFWIEAQNGGQATDALL